MSSNRVAPGRKITLVVTVINGLAIFITIGACFAEGEASTDRDEATAAMQVRVESLRVIVLENGGGIEADLVRDAVLRYSDPARETVDGSVWLWTQDLRPVALACLFTVPQDRTAWTYELTSVANQRLNVTGRSWWTWTPPPVEPAWKRVDGDLPAEGSTARLVQMRAIARRFSVSETLNGDDYHLRLLAQPVYRYAAPQFDVLDGALFAYAYGTNPELILLIECRRPADGDDPSPWFVSFARMSSAALTVRERGKAAWTAPEVMDFNANESYYAAVGPDPLVD
jgi:hypothetical protein